MQSSNPELQSLADYLSKHQSVILIDWEDIMKKGGIQASKLISRSREKFRNDIPTFLELLYDNLRGEEIAIDDVSIKHGFSRWEYGLSLQELAKEWAKLHLVLTNRINTYQELNSMSLPSFKKGQKILENHIHKGILLSINEYRELQQLEVEAQLRDLKQALKSPDEISYTEDLQRTSHDVRGMVHVLRTGFYLLENEKLSKKAASIIDQMSAANNSLNQLLNDLLDLFRLKTGREEVNIQSFDAANMLRDLCKSYQTLAKAEQLELRCKGDKKLLVHGDLKKVRRIVQNLVLNSLEYTQSGFVEVEWKLKQQDYWIVKICDTGPGLDTTHAASLTAKADLPASTESSQKATSSPEHHGEGIGLLIVRHLCELLNAIIQVNTEKDEGTTYKIVFPVEGI